MNGKSTEIRFQIISVNFDFKNIYVSVTDIGLRIFWQQYNYEKSFGHVLILHIISFYRVFSHDVTAAILVSQNNETAAMLVSQTNAVGAELFSYANAFFCFNKFA